MIKRRPTPSFILVLFLLVAVLLLVSCGPQSTFETKGQPADKQLTLFWVIFGLGVFVFVAVEGALIYGAFKYRRKPGDGIPKQIHGNPRLEVAWTIAPALVLVGVAVPTLIVIFDTAEGAGPDIESVNVDVIAHQWWWEFQYPDLDIATANELHVPVDKRINLTLLSDDVIHSFWVPNLRGKTDVIPNNENATWFIAEETGIFNGQCTEFCGLAHSRMSFKVVVESQQEFERWVEDYSRPASQPIGEAVQGASLFVSKGCALCHKQDGPDPITLREFQRQSFLDGNPVVPGPNLTHFATRTTMAAGILPLTEQNLMNWLRNPDDIKPGNRMSELATVYNDPTFALTEDEISALAAYLLSLYPDTGVVITPTPDEPVTPTVSPTTSPTPNGTVTPTVTPTVGPLPADPAAGQRVFQGATPLACTVCHSLDGSVGLGPSLQGIAATAGGRVPGLTAEEYIRQSILDTNAFVVSGFPADLMPTTFGETLTSQQIADVVAYLLTQ